MLLPLLFCGVSAEGVEETDSDAGESSRALAKEEGGELLNPVNPRALSAEKRPGLAKPEPKLVRRGGCANSAFVTGCEADSELELDEEEEKKNCGRRNELLRCVFDADGGEWCSGEERPEDEPAEEQDGDVEYIVAVQMVVNYWS